MKRNGLWVLGLSILALLGAGVRGRPLSPPPLVREEKPAASAAAAPPAEGRSAPLSSTPEADEALRISLLLSTPRQPVVIADSRLREARERAQRLAERLQANPSAWRDVLDLLCLMEPEETAVTLARLLGAGVDTRSEPELLERMNAGSRQSRCVALQLLSPRRSHEALCALVAAAEDREPRVRLAAMLALGDRPGEPGDLAYEALTKRARMDPDPILQDTARRLLGERVPPRQPAPGVHHGAFSGGLTLPSSMTR